MIHKMKNFFTKEDNGESQVAQLLSTLKHPLTQLPNKTKAINDLKSAYAKLHIEENHIAIAALDFENYLLFNTLLGNEKSTKVLYEYAQYLDAVSKSLNITLYHTIDNYFLLLLSNKKTTNEIVSVVETFQKKALLFTSSIMDIKLPLNMLAGLAIYPYSDNINHLLDDAYSALLKGKRNGNNNVTIYSDKQISIDSTKGYGEKLLFEDIQNALDNNEFIVYYQALVDVKTTNVVGAEALIRWNHPKYGLVSPLEFIPLLEKTGHIIDLGQYILKTVLKQQKSWDIFNFRQIQVSINVSMKEIESKNFVQHIEKELIHYNVRPERIKFELTESMAMGNPEDTLMYLKALKNLGVGLALDDFGTGYTSFSYLKDIPADTLKIDKIMVDNILKNDEDKRIVKGIIELGHSLGMKITVEGIENKAAADIVISLGCDYIQGYYYAKPLPLFEFQEFIRNNGMELI
ncbi:MAG: diguanylate cyclase/phosphodiesterase (GGDEF & EAL domains) with PAS/PAC sensor(s) [uncultured Sulfurovum sp.]|uniref:Diguanylate cyclase/phosphodiesterase (GGDEF & EAL domains) with PAS/PAC sensor(S) n=1 Tax=uncultured Sulfurovum sp. TaxID=269237 RepID=A0A6S6TS26_9BACT|nr:MAG: diguanylate cyclase/phosphodiesterase (GGDEF & EAL domains) with PAS/PAC sensor(s) [uncultured Sulfurovum sp.]